VTVDAGFARWLKEGVIFAPADDAATSALWGALARSSDIVSPLATKAGADAEGIRQIAFLKGPFVVDQHVVPGQRFDLLGRAVALTNPRLGYAGGVTVFVIGVEESEDVNLTALTVLRRLA
jgi:hypothetical protein